MMQNHGVANGAFGYYNISMGNVGASNMSWAPMNPNGYYYGSSSLAAVPAIPAISNVYNSEHARYQTINANVLPMRRQHFPFIGNDRICAVCGSPSTQLWRNIDSRGAKVPSQYSKTLRILIASLNPQMIM